MPPQSSVVPSLIQQTDMTLDAQIAFQLNHNKHSRSSRIVP